MAACFGRIAALVAFAYVLLSISLAAADEAASLAFFEAKIRPVLVSKCYTCHSAKAQADNKLKGDLLLDSKAALLKGGESGPAVVPGKPHESLLISALKHDDFEMPPQGKLPNQVIADFVRWVEMGAADPRKAETTLAREEIDFDKAAKFWAYQLPQRHQLPPVSNSTWAKTDIDRFVLAQMEKQGVHPVGSAAKRELIRRATFDLTGLPPKPAEIEAFLADNSPQAFGKVIDRLLESPHYGERWGRYWLDVARYAEDQAHTFGVKAKSSAYRYRDWVIQAMNKDMPYDQFVRLQIAGDLVLNETDDQFERIAGLGFFGLGAVYYKNSDKAKAIADELDDRIDTLTRGFLGLTVSCARCHDHKFDPIPTEDYYSLAGIFSNTRMVDRPLTDKATVDVYNAAQAKIRKENDRLNKFRTLHKQQLAESQRENVARYMVATWMYRHRKAKDNKYSTATLAKDDGLEREWVDRWLKYLDPNNNGSKNVAPLAAWRSLDQSDGTSDLAKAPQPVINAANEFQRHLSTLLDQRDGKFVKKTDTAQYSSPLLKGGLRLVDISADITGAKQLFLVVTDGGDDINNDWASWLNPLLTGPAGEKKLNELKWREGSTGWQSIQINKNAAGQEIKFNEKTYTEAIGTHATSIIVYDLPEGFTRFTAQGLLDGSGTGSIQFRVYTAEPSDIPRGDGSQLSKEQTELLKNIFSPSGNFTIGDKELVKYLDEQVRQELTEIEGSVEQAKQQSPSAPPMAHAVQDSGSQDMKVYLRGDPARQGDVAPRRFLRILAGADRDSYTEGSGRLELADAIASADNPLTARVMVNRVWQHHFGKGLVTSASNFGSLGERPTHPQLLDWLTVRFVESGWSLKWLHREIMQSAVYQSSSEQDAENFERDADNRWLWRMPRNRLDVESWRDALLAVSGNLNSEMGGPTIALSDGSNNRRTVYAKISRHDLDGLLRLFDFPDANVTSAARSQTTIPQQQLFVLNSDFFIRQSQALSARLQKEAADDPARIRLAYELLFGRLPDETETALATEFLSGEKRPGDKLSLWEQYAQALLSSNEFTYID